MSIPPEQAKSAIDRAIAGGANTLGGAIGGLNTQSPQAGSAAGQANIGQSAQVPPAVQMLAHQSLLMLIDSRVTAMIAATKTTESKAVTFVKKYWPLAAGVAVAITRLFH